MSIENEEAKNYFDRVGGEYLRVWDSLAKKKINSFELYFLARILSERASSVAPPNVLEIGIGPGRIAEQILKFDVTYYGADISVSMLNFFKEKFANNPRIKGLDVCNIGEGVPFRDLKFDCIVVWRVLYYLENWEKVIERLTTSLNPGGLLVFSMLNDRSTVILGKFFGGRLKGHNTNYGELRRVLKKNGFAEVRITGYARLPDVLYDWADTRFTSGLLILVERFLRIFLGETFFARMFYVVARK